MSKHSVATLHEMWKAANTTERFGQWFINRYIKNDSLDKTLDGVFNDSEYIAVSKIRDWLDVNCYSDTMPPKYREI